MELCLVITSSWKGANSITTFLKTMGSTNGRLMRWEMIVQQFDFIIKCPSGLTNGNADDLSR